MRLANFFNDAYLADDLPAEGTGGLFLHHIKGAGVADACVLAVEDDAVGGLRVADGAAVLSLLLLVAVVLHLRGRLRREVVRVYPEHVEYRRCGTRLLYCRLVV